MDHLNWGYLQLGLFALAFGDLQGWWISSMIRKWDLALPLINGRSARLLWNLSTVCNVVA